MTTVLVTGGSGYIGSYCILQLLAAGYRVRTTVRNLEREAEVRAWLKQSGDQLQFYAADLTADAGWAEAVAGCDYVLHVASPLPAGPPKHDDELVVPAREGTLRVLRASRDAGVKRVVQTSSFAAIGYGQKPQSAPYDETNWTDTSARLTAYTRSKTLAERAAWDFIEREGGLLELAVVNPVVVVGPALGPDFSSSVFLIKRLLDGGVPGVPRLYFGLVDVRDVADLHLRAMANPAAKGERFLAVSGDFMSLQEIGRVLRSRAGAIAARVPTRQLPDWIVRLGALTDARVRQVLPELGKVKNATSEKAQRLLGWKPRPPAESLLATAESLAQLGLLKATSS